jgi:SEC-C motif
LRTIPATRSMDAERRRAAIVGTFSLVREFAEDDQPLALMVGWTGGRIGKSQAIHVSSVDLREVLEVWDRLAEFAASPDIISLTLTDELPEEKPTQLKELLFEDGVSFAPAPQRPVIAAPKVGRNDPCPCGSGNKFKRCCAT